MPQNDGSGPGKHFEFTNMQWYLANSRNTVHMATFTREALSRQQVIALLERAIAHAPELMRAESISDLCHYELGGVSPADILHFQETDRLEIDPASWLLPRSDEYADSGKPALKAWYVSARSPDAAGNRGFFLVQTTHALSEGSDLGNMLKDSRTRRPDLRADAPAPGLAARMSLFTIAPLTALLHLTGALFEKKRVEDFSFVSLNAPSSSLADAARRLGVSRKTFLFASVLHSVTGPASKNGKQLFSYSTLPRKRIRLDVDDYLKLQMQLMSFKTGDDFSQMAKRLEGEIDRRADSGVLTQLFHNQVLSSHRVIQRFLPFVYHRRFWGQAPYNIVLSLVPPISPRGTFEVLSDNPIYAGSFTGTVQNCIFMVGRKHTTMNFWIHQSHLANVDRLISHLASYGVEARRFEKLPAVEDQKKKLMA